METLITFSDVDFIARNFRGYRNDETFNGRSFLFEQISEQEVNVIERFGLINDEIVKNLLSEINCSFNE